MRLSWGLVASLAAMAGAAPIMAPQLLAFPYHARVGASEVWSEASLPQPALDRVFARAAKLVASSPIARMPEGRHVFLTQGGWRWQWLTLGTSGAFAMTRAINEAIIVNRDDIATDRAWNGAALGGQRTISGLIAHETCHGMERRRFGLTVDVSKPVSLREGYCDYIARESSLSEADVAGLKARREAHPALAYYDGRRHVAAALASNGNDVDALFTAD